MDDDTLMEGSIPLDEGRLRVIIEHAYRPVSDDYGTACHIVLIGSKLHASLICITPEGLRSLAGLLIDAADRLDAIQQSR